MSRQGATKNGRGEHSEGKKRQVSGRVKKEDRGVRKALLIAFRHCLAPSFFRN